jgi:hypothetical protein
MSKETFFFGVSESRFPLERQEETGLSNDKSATTSTYNLVSFTINDY